MGGEEAGTSVLVEPLLGYHSCITGLLTCARDPGGGQCLAGSLPGAVASESLSEAHEGSLRMVGNHSLSAMAYGSLTGAVASERVSEAPKGSLRMDGNHPQSAKAKGSLTARATVRAGTKVGLSDPVAESGIAIAQRIKATLGITG